MAKSPKGGFNSFRNPARKVGSFPPAIKERIKVWRPGLNDRVLIPSGIGTIVEISGDLCLVDLENQVANVWERFTSIKPVR